MYQYKQLPYFFSLKKAVKKDVQAFFMFFFVGLEFKKLKSLYHRGKNVQAFFMFFFVGLEFKKLKIKIGGKGG